MFFAFLKLTVDVNFQYSKNFLNIFSVLNIVIKHLIKISLYLFGESKHMSHIVSNIEWTRTIMDKAL